MPLTTSARSFLCLGALLPVLVLAGCGGSGDDEQATPAVDAVLSAVAGLSGKARTAALVKLADAEGGQLSLYTSSALDYMQDLADAFEDEYGIDVALYKAKSEILAQRVVEERKAGFRGADVVEDNTPGLIALAHEEIIVPYASPAIGGLASGARDASWIADKSNTFVVAWNTDRVRRGEEPRSFADLASPRWKGRLGLEVTDSDWYKTIWEHLAESGGTPAAADRLFAGIARNATFVKGHSLLLQLTAAGEFDVMVDAYLHSVKGLVEKGAPLDWQPAVEPVVTRPDGIAVVENASHPAAALLFVDFTLGPGQTIFQDVHLTPARANLGLPPSIGRVAVDVPDYVGNQAEWEARYETLAQLGKKASTDG